MVLWNTPGMPHVRRVSRALRPGVARTPYPMCRSVILALVVIRDQMGTSKSRRQIAGSPLIPHFEGTRRARAVACG